jgi:hypothetical protein
MHALLNLNGTGGRQRAALNHASLLRRHRELGGAHVKATSAAAAAPTAFPAFPASFPVAAAFAFFTAAATSPASAAAARTVAATVRCCSPGARLSAHLAPRFLFRHELWLVVGHGSSTVYEPSRVSSGSRSRIPKTLKSSKKKVFSI